MGKKYSTEEQQRRAKINKRRKMLRAPLTFIENICRRVRNFWRDKIYLPIKWAYQRVVRGYDDRAHWDMEWWFREITPKIIREIKKHMPGAPVGIEYDDWMNILEEMALCFENSNKEDELKYDDSANYEEHSRNYYSNIDKGLSLFVKHFHSLWW